MARRRARQSFTAGPFRGMRAAWRSPVDEALAYEIGNMLPVNRALGPSPLVQVPPHLVMTGLASAPAQTDQFAASNALDALNETAEAVLDPAGASSDNYLIHYSVEVRTLCPVSGSQQAGLTLAIETNDDPGGAGVWVERSTIVYSVTAQAGVGACAAQSAIPDADIVAFNGAGTAEGQPDYSQLDEATYDDDTSYRTLTVDEDGGPATSEAEVGLSDLTDPLTSSGHVLHVRYKSVVHFGANGTVAVLLKEGATTRATRFLTSAPGVWVSESFTLSGGEANSITNYANLSVRFEAQAELDSSSSHRITWVRFDVPGASAESGTWPHEQKLITVAGLGVNDKVRLKVKSVENGSLLQGFTVHGFDGVGDPAAGVTYNAGASNPVQGFGVLREESYAVAGGELFKLDYATATWTLLVTRANLTTALGGGNEPNTTGEVYLTAFVNGPTPVLVISDGTHTPFFWTGASGAGGLTLMNNAPVFYGQPTVYYAKLFAIKSTERDTITWCEENQPNTGYEAGGYNNAWTLSQTGGGTLFCLVGTNQALFYFRDTSIGSIRGPVDTDFTASGVHDDVSSTVGTTSPRGASLHGDVIWVQDAEGRPYAFRPGEAPEPVWQQIADYWGRPAGDPNQYTPGNRIISPGAWVSLDADHLVACCWAASATQAGGVVLFDLFSRQALCVLTPAYGDDYAVVGPGYARSGSGATLKLQPLLMVGYFDGSSVAWPPFFTAGSQYGLTTPTRIAATPWVRLHAGFGAQLFYLWDLATLIGYAGEGDGAEVNVNVTPYWAATNDLTLPTAPATFKFFQTAGLTAGVAQALTQESGTRRSRRLVWGLERESRHLLAAFVGMPGLEQVILDAGVMAADPARP